MSWQQNPNLRSGILDTAKAIGANPLDLATAISYETAGTFDPTKRGPTTQWGQHRGLIQFGEPQAKRFGVDWNNPVGSQLGANGAIAQYFRASGFKPGMSGLDLYSTINAGSPGRYSASDAANGGAPGSVQDKWMNQMSGHRAKAQQLLYAAAPGPNGSQQALESMAVGQSAPMGAPQPAAAASPQDGFQMPKSIFGLSTQAPDPNGRAAAIAKAIGLFGAGLASDNVGGGLAAAANVAGEFGERQAFGKQLDGMNLTPQQRGVLDVLGPDRSGAVLAQQAFPQTTEFDRLLAGVSPEDAERARRVKLGIDVKPGDPLDEEYKRAQIANITSQIDERTNPNVRDQFGLNPIYGKDAEGNIIVMQPSKSGGLVQANVPEGITLQPGVEKIDLGTEWGITDRSGVVIQRIPKDLAGAEREKELGQKQGAQLAGAPGDIQNSQNALDLIDQIRNDPYIDRGTGGTSILNAVPGTGGYDFANKVEGAKSGAFLAAVQQMRGLGSLSNAEGTAATAAINRMNVATSKEAFLDALGDYEKIVRQGMARAQGRLNDPAAVSPAGPTDAPASAPPASFKGDPKLWNYMTPEQRALWK